MTGLAKGRLALLVLGGVLLCSGLLLATSPSAHLRYWRWRMQSSDRAVRAKARLRLLEIGRPAIDGFFADIVAGEVVDRVAKVPVESRVIFVGREDHDDYHVVESSYFVDTPIQDVDGIRKIGFFVENGPDPTREILGRNRKQGGRELVVIVWTSHYSRWLAVALPQNDPLAASVIEETQRRLAASR